jgi:hypothetical protein
MCELGPLALAANSPQESPQKTAPVDAGKGNAQSKGPKAQHRKHTRFSFSGASSKALRALKLARLKGWKLSGVFRRITSRSFLASQIQRGVFGIWSGKT